MGSGEGMDVGCTVGPNKGDPVGKLDEEAGLLAVSILGFGRIDGAGEE